MTRSATHPSDRNDTGRATDALFSASQWRLIWLKFRDHRLARWSLYGVILLYVVAVFCEFLAPQDPRRRNAARNYSPPQRLRLFHAGRPRLPFVYAVIRSKDPETLKVSYAYDETRPLSIRVFVKGDAYKLWKLIPADRHLLGLGGGERLYLLGADRLGRDLFSRILYGSRISLSVGLVGVGISLVLGVIIGGISGYYGGWVDDIIQRFIEILSCLPTIPLWLSLSAAMPPLWSNLRVFFCMTVILALIGWTGLARVVRGKFLALREEDYVTAARTSGTRDRTIILRHMAPAFLSHLIVSVTLAIPGMILAETSLSFLRLGLRPPTISWGVLLQDAQNVSVIANYPWLLLPVAFVAASVLLLNFLGDGLRDAADPYSH